jgi:hypothetical protein
MSFPRGIKADSVVTDPAATQMAEKARCRHLTLAFRRNPERIRRYPEGILRAFS